jgi:uncharacterized protein (TIRG00374 family)
VSRKIRLAIFAAGLFLFAWLVVRAGPEVLLADARRAGWMLVPIVLVYAVVYFGFATTWWLTLGDAARRPSLATVYRISISGFALNYLTPFVNLGGEPYKAAAVSGAVGGRRAAGSVVVYNVLHSLSHVLIWLLAILLALALLPRSPVLTTALALVGTALLVLMGIVLSARRTGILAPVVAVLGWIPFTRRLRSALEARRAALAEVDGHILGFFRARPGRFLLALSVDMLSRAFSYLEFWLIFLAVGAAQPLWKAFVLGGFSTLSLNLLFFVPFEMGSREGSMYLLFQLFGFGPALAVFTVIANRLRQVVWIGIGLGLVGLSGRRAAAAAAAGDAPAPAPADPVEREPGTAAW